MKPVLELRILSGPSLGAAIELAGGVYTVGADDACDLVLAADSSVAGRHLELRIQMLSEGQPPEVFARPLEGEIAINGTAVPDSGAPLGNGEVLGLGFTALAWQPIGGAWGRITLAPLEFARLVSSRAAEENPETENAESAESAQEKTKGTEEARSAEATPPSSAPPETVESGAGRESGPPPVPRRGSLFRAGVTMLVSAALIFALILAWLALSREIPDLPPPMDAAARQLQEVLGKGIPGLPPSPDAAARQLREALETEGFRGIRVKTGVSRALVLRGTVENDRELRRMLKLAADLPFRVHVGEVRVGSDLLRVTRETLNAHGFFPEVRYRDAGDDLDLALYLKDRMVETGMMASLAPDLPKLDAASRKVAYARDVEPVLLRELSRLGLEGKDAVYLAGKVILPFRLDFKARRELDAALAAVRESLGVPVFFQVTETMDALPGQKTIVLPAERPDDAAPMAADGPAGGENAADKVPAAPVGLGGLEVMSVTVGEIPFVTMRDQQKFFPGAVLPGGAVLVSIHADHLVLQDGGETITYPLKEKP
ncbi:MAG: type III secretion system inner membrane ring subunit SctD [Candidatus Accumulibacter sp.]|jgi:type III secretion system YscD/HrpQ family protein|nr:type III secretion system inner membrane ring subunit SctD [Accumulibacter sp.]